MDFSVIMPLPSAVTDNPAGAFGPLAGAAPVARVVRSVLGSASDAAARTVVVSAARPLLDEVRAVLGAQDLSTVRVVPAGGTGTRTECIVSGFEEIQRQQIPPRYVLIADHRHPLVMGPARDRVIAGLRAGHAAVMPAVAVTDSVKTVGSGGSVTATVDRTELKVVQSPRGFAAAELFRLLQRPLGPDFDELREALHAGLELTLVAGDPDGFRVDLPADAPFAEAVIASRTTTDPAGAATIRQPRRRGHR